jgi:hypothetical protein
MSTRQLRLNTRALIRSRLGEFTGKEINIVLDNRIVFLITLSAFDGVAIKGFNKRLQNVEIRLDEVNEIYFDTKE